MTCTRTSGMQAMKKGRDAAMTVTDGGANSGSRSVGEAQWTAVVDAFYLSVTGDPLLAAVFARIDLPALRQHQRQFLSTVLVAAQEPTRMYLRAAHQDLHITPRQFDAVARHLEAALHHAGVAPAEITQVMRAVAQYADDIIGR
jgi:hemoglobin